MRTLLVILAALLAVILAFPLAIAICAAAGAVLTIVERRTTPCPQCNARRLRNVNAIHETYPTGRGTGTFYRCEACDHRAFWSNDDRGWKDASSREFDKWYEPRIA